MPDKVIHPTVDELTQDWNVLFRLLTEGDQRPWSVAEIIRDSNDEEVNVIDAIGRLQRGGLIHRTQDDLIYPTRAAIYCAEIVEH